MYHFQKIVACIKSKKHFGFCGNYSEFPLTFTLNLSSYSSARFYNSKSNNKLFNVCPFRSSALKIWVPTGRSFIEFHFWTDIISFRNILVWLKLDKNFIRYTFRHRISYDSITLNSSSNGIFLGGKYIKEYIYVSPQI